MHVAATPARAVLALLLASVMLMVTSASANAAVSYLRPDADMASTSPWTVTGATRAWEALDDNVTESEMPVASDYISTSAAGRSTVVGLQTAPIAGTANLVAEAWIYSTTSNPVYFEAKSGGQLAKETISKSGWTSIKIPGITQQSKLDSLVFAFGTSTTSSGLHQVPAAFLKLSYSFQPRVYWGARMDGEVAKLEKDQFGNPLPLRGDAPWNSETWDIFESHTEKPVSIVHFGQPAPWLQAFTADPLERASKRGAIPMMSMGSNGATLHELEEGGAKEAALRKWAKDVAAYKKPFFFRWDWEMNLISAPNIPWAAEARANPSAFVRAWRNFRRIADQEGATNVTWVWCPNVSFPGSTSLNSLYPGNAYVDWTCMDGYNRGTKTPEWTSWIPFHSVFSSTYRELTDDKEFEGWQKPIMIGEFGSTEAGGSKSAWISQALKNDLPWSFPRIKAVVWFNWNITEKSSGGIETEWDWPIESSTGATEAFAGGIASPYYAENTFGSLPLLTRIQPLP